jgi:hypothetical protein
MLDVELRSSEGASSSPSTIVNRLNLRWSCLRGMRSNPTPSRGGTGLTSPIELFGIEHNLFLFARIT